MHEFKTLLKKHRERLGISLDRLSALTGISKQHLSNLQNGHRKLSINRLSSIIVLLSQKQLHPNQKEYGGQSKNEYFAEYGFPEQNELHLDILKELLFSAASLSKYESNYIVSRAIATNTANEFEKNVSINAATIIDKYFAEYGYNKKPLDQLKHNYQVWTVGEVLGETVSDEDARETAKHIVTYKVKHVNFVPLTDNTQWRIALNKVIKYSEIIIAESEDNDIKHYWKGRDIRDYMTFYGISKVAFFTSFRIYNPFSPRAVGTYNVGGKTKKSSKLIDILASEIPLIVEKLKPIVYSDEAQLLEDGKNYIIEEINCTANKKIFKNV